METLCKKLYESSDSDERKQAESALLMFSNSLDCLPKCQLLLERRDVCFHFHFEIFLLIKIFDFFFENSRHLHNY